MSQLFSVNPFDDFTLLDQIHKSTFSIYKVFIPAHNKYYALKVFPFINGKVSNNFLSEARLASFNHPNIISIKNCEFSCKSIFKESSLIFMEYALYGDFVDLVETGKFLNDEKLIRTYFRQLVNGLEYLHRHDVAHMDIKLENLLLGKDLNLKIIDFEFSTIKGKSFVKGKGTPHFRAPEVRAKNCQNPKAADIYSMGIVLFTLLTGSLPYFEDEVYEGEDLFELLKENKTKFWEIHEKRLGGSFKFDSDLKELFCSLVHIDPKRRANFDQIRKNPWFKGPIYNTEELEAIWASEESQ